MLFNFIFGASVGVLIILLHFLGNNFHIKRFLVPGGYIYSSKMVGKLVVKNLFSVNGDILSANSVILSLRQKGWGLGRGCV